MEFPLAEHPTPSRADNPSRAEKLSILSALLGPDALAKLREGQSTAPSMKEDGPVEIDAERAAWHRNKLLERLRNQVGSEVGQPKATQEMQAKPTSGGLERSILSATSPGVGGAGFDAKLTAISDPDTLGQEHPAVIARLMMKLPREDRVTALKSLPGPVARSIVRRLK